jgi:hypothetical protein
MVFAGSRETYGAPRTKAELRDENGVGVSWKHVAPANAAARDRSRASRGAGTRP